MIQKANPALHFLPSMTQYYDVKLVTSDVDDNHYLVVTFLLSLKHIIREILVLYEIEVVSIYINDLNNQLIASVE